MPHVLFPFAPHLTTIYPLFLLNVSFAAIESPSFPASLRERDDIPEALVDLKYCARASCPHQLPFIQQQPLFFIFTQYCLYHHPWLSNPRAHIPGLNGLDSTALSVSVIDAPHLLLISYLF
jgi:hypothetical protein